MTGRSQNAAFFLAVAIVVAAIVIAAQPEGAADRPALPLRAIAPTSAAPKSAPTAKPTPVPTVAPVLAATAVRTPAPTVKPPPPPPPPPDPKVIAAQTKLIHFGYWMPEATGFKNEHYTHAVIALQKTAGLPRSGILDTASKAALAKGVRPQVRTKAGWEVDREHQLLILSKDGAARWIFDTSTGKPSTPTYAGSYHIYKEYNGLRHSRLGWLWRPKYFDHGRAIHGFRSVPTYAASHGCVRVTYTVMNFLWDQKLLPKGVPVLVY